MSLGLTLARLAGWEEPPVRVEYRTKPCPQCPIHLEQIATLQATVEKQSVTLAEQNTTRLVEGQSYRETIHRLEVKLADHHRLLAAQLGTVALSPDLMLRASVLTKEPAAASLSGEAKRHQVYAKLIKEFPNESKRDLGLAIELALRVPQAP